jgi:hypothetical protein
MIRDTTEGQTMTTQEIHAAIRQLLVNGMHFVPRRAEHTPEGCAQLEVLLNRALGKIGRSARVTLDDLGMMVVLNPLTPAGEPT